MKTLPKLPRGFTLIELLVVITIIAVLAGIGLVSYRQASASARDAKRISDMETVKQALVLYRTENTGYPGGSGGHSQQYDDIIEILETADYISNPTPQDPTGFYRYARTGNAQAFCVCALLENTAKGNSAGLNFTQNCDVDVNPAAYYCARNP